MPMRQRLHTVYEYLALWFGLGMLGLVCLLWSPFSLVLYRLQPRSAGGRLGRYMNMHEITSNKVLWLVLVIAIAPLGMLLYLMIGHWQKREWIYH